MATVNFTVKHRPVRIGLLVRPGELEDLRKAAHFASLLRGGMYNPIIPVGSETDAIANGLTHTFQPDVLISIAKTDAIERFAARYPYLQSSLMTGRGLFVEDWRSKKFELAYLDVLSAIDKYWEQEFKNTEPEQSLCRLVTWDDNDPLRDLFILSYGAYDAGLNLKQDFRDSFVKGLRATVVSIDIGKPVPDDLIKMTTPMRLTVADLRSQGRRFRSWPGGVYFGNGSNTADLTTFWNVRAAAGNVVFCCLASGGRTDALAKAQIDFLDGLPDRHPNIKDHLAVFCRNDRTAVEAALKAMMPKKRILLYDLPQAGGDIRGVDAIAPRFDWETALAMVDRDSNDYTVTLALPDQRFLPSDRSRRKAQLLVAGIDSRGELAFPGYTLNPPYRPSLTEFYGRSIRIDPWSVRSEPDGIAVSIDSHTKTVHLRPIKHAAVIGALFEEAGLKIEPSVGGRLADRLLEALGGFEATRVFKIRGVRNLIAGLDSQTAIGRGQATTTIWNDGQFKDHEHLYIEARDKRLLTTQDTFDFLLKHSFFRAGLEFKCDNCGLSNWLSLREVDDRWVCEYCGHGNLTSLHVRDRGDWKFRKSGLLAKDNNQEGAIPVILALLAIGRILDNDQLLRLGSVNVIAGVPACEIDFIAVSHHDEEVSCGIGEAKSAGGIIDANDVENLKGVADRLGKAGLRPYLMFAKTADAFEAFEASELSLFRGARDAGYHVILLANAELEPYQPYENADRDKLPASYPASFDEMVANTEAGYLSKKP